MQEYATYPLARFPPSQDRASHRAERVMLHMRFFVTLAMACAFVAAGISPAAATPTTSLDITANGVSFFSNRFIVTADGNVHVRLSDGTVISGETFSMDLKLNRYLIAGDVHIDGPTIHAAGAAFAGYPDLDRSFFLPAGGTPERLTYFGLNWADGHPGREQPGDAFAFPDLSGERVYIKSAGVRIVPKTNALFSTAQVYTAGVYLPFPRYVVTFSSNPHFFENAFAGARADVALPFNGSAHSLTALHVRNDQYNGTYLAIDQHFVWDDSYIVAAIDPLTQEQRQYNLIGYKRFTPKLESRLFLQESAGGPGIIFQPINAAAFGELQINAGLRRSGLSYTQDNYYNYILGIPEPQDDTVATASFDPRWREHPVTGVLTWTGYENRIAKYLPLLFRLRSDVGFAHDIYGYGGYANEQPGPPSSYYEMIGGTLYTPAIKVGRYAVNLSYDRQRTFFNLPHQIDLGDSRGTISRNFSRQHLNAFLTYEVRTTDDYWGAAQLAAYPPQSNYYPYTDSVTTTFGTYSGQDAFRGLATSHGWTSGTVYTPTQYFAFNLQVSRFYDFPVPVPGAYGQPPWQLTADVRFRVSRQVLVDLSRSQYFNFANQRWSPQFGIQFLP
jgi:hypothetical protein